MTKSKAKKIEVRQAVRKRVIEVKKPIKFEDDATELAEMADFYKKDYAQVYFVYDMKAEGVVAVEVVETGVIGPLRDGRKFHNYKNRLLGYRERLDLNENGKPMIGYESISGNDTRESKYEEGEIGSSDNGQPAGSLSPFERSKIKAIVAQKSAGEKADYEAGVDEDGREFERFETFKVVRVK